MYDINGKVYTDVTFVDEMVHNIKLILNGIVIKNSELADTNETEESIRLSDIYLSIKRGTKTFELFDYTYKYLSQIEDFSEDEIINYEIDNTSIPIEYRDRLFDLAAKDFLDDYVETNNYYRNLNGLPDYGVPGLFIEENMIPVDIRPLIDISKPIHEMDDYQIGLLQSYGVLSRIQQNNPDDLYLLHLGSKKIDIFEARSAGKFDILYIPSEVEPMVANRFREIYEKERIIYFKKHYSLAYKFNSDYYDEFFIIMLLSQAATDLISEIPEWYIRRDIFDIHTIEALLESNGVKYFEEIPLKYQISLVRYLNKIIKFKSCNKNIYDLINIFDFNDAIVYKYYLVKNRLSDDEGNYITAEDIKDMYELFFVRVPLDGTLANSITDNTNIESYNSIVTNDKWWNGPEDHDYVYESILKKNFSSQITKYMSLEVKYDIKEYQFQSIYFLNMIFNNKIDTSELKLEVPIINTSTKFTIRDLFVLLFVVSFTYFDKTADGNILIDNRDRTGTDLNFGKHPIGDYSIIDPNAILPEYNDESADGGYSLDEDPYLECNGGNAMDSEYEDIDGGLLKIFDLDADGKYAWDDEEDLYNFDGGDFRNHRENVNANGSEEYPFDPIFDSHIIPHIDLDPCFIFEDNFKENNLYEIDLSNRIFGFNPDADLEYLASVIGNYHSSYGFDRGYTLEELGVENFMVPTEGSISSPEELMNIYKTNKEIYDNLYEKVVDANSEDEYRVYKFAFDYLFTMDMNKEYYTKNNGELATTYLEFLKDQNIILYNFYNQLMDEDNDDIRKSTISTYIDQVIDSIDLYINNDLEYLYYSVATTSWNSTMQYLSLLINFFKSYKVQFLDIGGTLVFDNEVENNARPNDKIGAIDAELLRGDTYNINDTIASLEVETTYEDRSTFRDEIKFEYDYGDTWYDLNGDTSSTKLSYIVLNGNIEYIDNFRATEDDYRIDVEELDDEEVEFDGGSCFNTYSDEAFFDLDAVDASYIEDYDDSYEEEYDWDGGDSSFHITEDVMDNGPAAEQRFYADYCPQDKDFRFPDEVNYDPRYQGYVCDGRYAGDEIWYWQGNALYAEYVDDTIYELDGGRCWMMDSDSFILELYNRNKKNEEDTYDASIIINDIEYCKVNPIFDYSNDHVYYTLNQYTGEMEIVNNITQDNYQNYLDTGLLYFTIQDEIHATEVILAEYEGYTLDDLWDIFKPTTKV